MNSQTRAFRAHNVSTKVSKGTPVPKGPRPDALANGALTIVEFPSTKGTAVNSSADRAANGHKPWKGCGNALGRDGVTYEVPTGSVVPLKVS